MASSPSVEAVRTTGDPLGIWDTSPEEWPEIKLWDLADYINGRAFKPSDFSRVGLQVIKITELKYGVSPDTSFYDGPYDKKHLLEPNDLLFAWSGNPETSLDAFRWRDGRALLNQHIFRVIPHKGIDKTYLYFLFKFLRPTFIRTARDKATSMGHVKVSDLKRLIARVPPPEEQDAIAAILGTLADKIELNRKMNVTLEAMARAIFKCWFVDFEPVRAGAEGRDPGLPKPLADLFPDSFEESELGEIPQGWEIGTLADFTSLNPESWSKDTRPDVINYVDLSNTKWGRIETVMAYARQDAPSRAQRVLRPGDTIIGTVRPGNGSFAFITEDGLTGSTGFGVLRPRRSDCAEFTYLAATSVENIEALSHLADGGAYPAIRPEVVAATQVISPDDKVLAEFAKRVAPLLTKIAKNGRESRTLAAFRHELLPKLLSGEIRVKDAEKFVGSAV